LERVPVQTPRSVADVLEIDRLSRSVAHAIIEEGSAFLVKTETALRA